MTDASEHEISRLEGRGALVTGAGRGIGRAIARALLEAGARIAVTDRDGDSAAAVALELDETGEQAFSLTLDVRDREGFSRAVETSTERLGAVDILVNNAAVMLRTSVWEIDEEEWDEVMAINLRGVLFGCQLAVPAMRERGWGRIVNLSSLAGQQGGLVAGAHYAASKAGIVALTKVVAAEVAGEGITVNAIAPAAISGPAMDALPDAMREELPARIPVARVGTPEEVAALATFLCSDDAGYITGATLDVNGGLFMR